MNVKEALNLDGDLITLVDISSLLFVTWSQDIFLADSDEDFASGSRIKVEDSEWILPRLRGVLWPYGGSEVLYAEEVDIKCNVSRRKSLEVTGIARVIIRNEDGELILEPPAVK